VDRLWNSQLPRATPGDQDEGGLCGGDKCGTIVPFHRCRLGRRTLAVLGFLYCGAEDTGSCICGGDIPDLAWGVVRRSTQRSQVRDLCSLLSSSLDVWVAC
jgi:hypothetical protein